MPCKCNKNKKQDKPKKKSFDSVPLKVLKERREICRDCPHSTKSKDNKFRKFNGLNNNSTCELSGRFINECTADSNYACPDDRFDESNSEI